MSKPWEGKDSRAGDVVVYACDTGYRLQQGTSNRIVCCDPEYSWTSLPVCVPRRQVTTCGDAPVKQYLPTIDYFYNFDFLFKFSF